MSNLQSAENPPSESLEEMVSTALGTLVEDGFLAYPTETVWGLGAVANRHAAIDRLLAWKGRDAQSPLAVLVPSLLDAENLGCEIAPRVHQLADAFWPGPLMLVVPCGTAFAPGVARIDGALGIRCSSHPLAAALACGVLKNGLGPLTSTSLNRSGEPPVRDLAAAEALLRVESERARTSGASGTHADGADSLGQPRLVGGVALDAGGADPSTVVDCTRDAPDILRVGAIGIDEILEVWNA